MIRLRIKLNKPIFDQLDLVLNFKDYHSLGSWFMKANNYSFIKEIQEIREFG